MSSPLDKTLPAFRTQGVTKIYGSGHTAVHAPRGVDIDIPGGELTVLLRASGSGDAWAVFVVSGNRAILTPVKVGHNNGVKAEILDGLKNGETVILYPGPDLTDGMRVEQRQLEN